MLTNFSFHSLLCVSVLILSIAADAKNISSGQININTASEYELTLLYGIGSATAKKIIQSRQQQSFSDVNELLERRLVRPQYFKRLKQHAIVDGDHNYVDPHNRKKSAQSKAFKKPTEAPTINWNEAINDAQSIKLLTDQAYWPELQQHLLQAKQSIWLSTFAFKTSDSPRNSIHQLIKLLGKKVAEGVAVFFLLEQSDYHRQLSDENHQLAKQLKNMGIQVYFDSMQVTHHSKLVIIDSRFNFLGSFNLTHSAFNRNHEVGVMIESPKLAEKLQHYLQAIRVQS